MPECTEANLMDIEQVAIHLLSIREHTVYQLHQKLQKKGFEAVQVEEVLDDLAQRNLVSDERFAEQYLRMRSDKGYGPVRISQEMRERGVPDVLIEHSLQGYEDDWQDLLQQVVKKKFGSRPVKSFNDKAKRARFLEYRGFPSAMIHDYLSHID